MKQFKELSVKEMQQVSGGNSGNPGTSNWINGMGQGGNGSSSGGSTGLGQAGNHLVTTIGQCIAWGMSGQRGPRGCGPN